MTRRPVAKRRPSPALPTPAHVPVAESALQEPHLPAPASAEAATEEQRHNLVEDFAATLDRRDDLDEDGRDFLLQQYREALENAADDLSVSIPDRMQWIETVDALKASGLLSDEDSNNLIRSFDEAMHPLQSPEFKEALELATRMRDGGEESALAWLESRRAKADSAEETAAGPVPEASPEHARRPVTGDRRVRRPRGPPIG